MRILYTYKKINVKYGLLYNYYVISDARGIAPSGWSVPTKTDFETLITSLGGLTGLSEKLRETGDAYWQSPNTGATNSSGLNGRGAGHRTHDTGIFTAINVTCSWRSSTAPFGVWDLEFEFNNTEQLQQFFKAEGVSIRLVNNSTSLSDGQRSTMRDNNGNLYETICIGTQEWMAGNLKTTKYNNGDAIPEVTDNATWAGLTSGAFCYYDNDPSYM